MFPQETSIFFLALLAQEMPWRWPLPFALAWHHGFGCYCGNCAQYISDCLYSMPWLAVVLEQGLRLDTGDEVSSNTFSALGVISAKKERNRGTGRNACCAGTGVETGVLKFEETPIAWTAPRQIPAVDRRRIRDESANRPRLHACVQ